MDTPVSNTLPKKERLCGKTNISNLLAKGKHGSVQDMRYLFLKNDSEGERRMMVSVPKKLFKRAVKRNLLKRRIREAYRRQKHLLAGGVDILFIYTSREILPYETIFAAVGAVIEQINNRTRS